jgi:hypothetical protein
MQRFLGLLIDSDGTPMSGVTVTVKKAGTGTNATLYSDNIYTAKSNAFTNDSDGTYEFYAPNGRIDLVYTKAGKTFTDANSSDVILYDPADDPAAVVFRDDFLSVYGVSSSILVSEGHFWGIAGASGSVTGDATYRNGWINVIEGGGAQGQLNLGNSAGAAALNWALGTDAIMLDLRVEKVGAAVAGTRRVGFSGTGILNVDPSNGVFIRQIDANNAFLVCRAGGSEATQDLGVTLTAMKKIRVVATTASVRAFVDDVAKTAVTTQIPTAILGLAAGGGATASAAGLRLDYLNVYNAVRV